MSQGPARFQITSRQALSLVVWITIGVAANYWSRVAGDIALSSRIQEGRYFALAWICIFTAGASFGSAVGVILRRRLLWAIVGVFAWPVATIIWENLKSSARLFPEF
jgi:hypothetical protein